MHRNMGLVRNTVIQWLAIHIHRQTINIIARDRIIHRSMGLQCHQIQRSASHHNWHNSIHHRRRRNIHHHQQQQQHNSQHQLPWILMRPVCFSTLILFTLFKTDFNNDDSHFVLLQRKNQKLLTVKANSIHQPNDDQLLMQRQEIALKGWNAENFVK